MTIKDCEACGDVFEVLPGRGANNRITCYECTKGHYKTTWRNKHLKRTYGVTLFQTRKMFEEQGGKCKVCESEMSFDNVDTKRGEKRFNNGAVVDHCHSTGEVRGMLCFNCNTALGHLFDNIEILDKMKKYLQKA